jgi:hypothetical protein
MSGSSASSIPKYQHQINADQQTSDLRWTDPSQPKVTGIQRRARNDCVGIPNYTKLNSMNLKGKEYPFHILAFYNSCRCPIISNLNKEF